MKIGAVCSPGLRSNPSNVARQVNLLDRMRARTARISMYFDPTYDANGQANRRYGDYELDLILNVLRTHGPPEMIFQTTEMADAVQAWYQLEKLLPYIDGRPDVLFVFELGNEPDIHGETPSDARYRRLSTIKHNKPRQGRGNLLWAINMPSQNASPDYFNAFVNDYAGDGLGNLLTGVNAPDVVTVHCYGATSLCRDDRVQPYKMIDWVRGYTARNIKVTESGINDNEAYPAGVRDRGKRYVEFANKVAAPRAQLYGGGGDLDSVCFYGLPDVEDFYEITEPFADEIGSRVASNVCSY